MPRKKDPTAQPTRRGPKNKLEERVYFNVTLDRKHLDMLASYRRDHPELETDSAVVRLAIERLCAPVESGTAEKEEADRDDNIQPRDEAVGQTAENGAESDLSRTHEVDDG